MKSLITKETVSGDAPNPNDLYLEAKGDCVYAGNLDSDSSLPRITPVRFTGALVYQGEKLGSRVEVQYVNSQNRVAQSETPTAGYTFLNASVNSTFGSGRLQYDLYVRGTNLTNAKRRDTESFLKEVLPPLGRSVAVGLKVSF